METENIEQTADDLPKEVVDHICKEETKARRKATWEECFERFEEYDQDPQLAEEWDVRKENDLVTVVGKLDSLVGGKYAEETDSDSCKSEDILEDTPVKPQGDNETQRFTAISDCIVELKRIDITRSNKLDGSKNIKDTLAHCNASNPGYICFNGTESEDESDNNSYFGERSKHDDSICTITACSDLNNSYRMSRENSYTNNKFSFEENRLRSVNASCSGNNNGDITLSFEENRFRFYGTTNVYINNSTETSKSITSFTDESSLRTKLVQPKSKTTCIICKVDPFILNEKLNNRKKRFLPICKDCCLNHADCKTIACSTCSTIGQICTEKLSLSVAKSLITHESSKEMKDTGQSHQYVKLQDPNNSSFIRRFQEQKIDHKKSLNSSRPDFSPMKHRIPHDTSIENYKPEELSNDSMNQCIFSPTKNYKARTKHQFSINKTLRSALSSGSSDLGLSIEKDLNISASKSKRRFTLKTPKKK